VIVATHGVWSSFELGLGTRLAMEMSLCWWSFEESVVGFFVRCAAIMGFFIVLTYYGSSLLRRRKPART
jgi:hypothetical protein